MALRDRLRPWHALLLAVFALGTGVSLERGGPLTRWTAMRAVLSGLVGVLVFQFTVGNVWGYAVEYRNAGGRWSDRAFLAPFVVAGVGGVAAGGWSGSAGVGAWVAFWLFVVGAGVLALSVQFLVGYRNADA